MNKNTPLKQNYICSIGAEGAQSLEVTSIWPLCNVTTTSIRSTMVTLAVFDCWVMLTAPRSKLIDATLSTTVPTGVPSGRAGMLHKVT